MKISNAFQRTTAKGHKIYRIRLDEKEILSCLEQGNTILAIDVVTRNGVPSLHKGVDKNGKPYEALHYYFWSKRPNAVVEEVKVEELALPN